MRKLFLFLFLFASSVWAGKYPIVIPYKVEPGVAADQYIVYYNTVVAEVGAASEEITYEGWNITLYVISRGGPGDTVFNNGVSNVTGAPIERADGRKSIGEQVMATYEKAADKYKNGWLAYASYAPHHCLSWGEALELRSPLSFFRGPVTCIDFPPATEWCKITTPEILLDHGTITLKQAEGSTATSQMGVRCTTQMAVAFNLITDDKYVYLDEGKSEIKINNLPLKSKIELPQGDSTLPVKDYLTGVTKEGFHTGSSVLVMQPY